MLHGFSFYFTEFSRIKSRCVSGDPVYVSRQVKSFSYATFLEFAILGASGRVMLDE